MIELEDALSIRPAIACHDLGKRYRDRWVLRDVSFNLPHGQCMALVGLNGAGKTSLLRLLLDFVRPDTGHALLYGIAATQPKARAAMAFLPERFMPPPDLTGTQVLQMVLGVRGMTVKPDDAHQRLTQLGFDPAALRRPTRELSKGMTQKLGLCATLLSASPLMILDEPFSGLDPIARRSVASQLASLKAQGHSLLFTSHSLNGLSALCDRLGVIHEGRLRFIGSPLELLNRYERVDIEDAFIRCVQPDHRPAA